MKNQNNFTRGLLIHASHYDPTWCDRKVSEEPFDAETAMQIVDTMARTGMNLLVIDCSDGVRYRSHPELARPYTVPMEDLRQLCSHARELGIDVAPKLNFAKSGRNQHDQWMAPHPGADQRNWMRGQEDYWRVAVELAAELVDACKPRTFFHVGMDEDHYRSLAQYVDAIKTLRRIVASHKLRAIVWNDSCHFKKTAIAQVHADKCRDAERFLPRDVVHVLWDYNMAHPSIVKRLTLQGFTVWGAPGASPQQVKSWRRAIAANGGGGLLMTKWIKCSKANKEMLLAMVEELAPLYR